MPEIRMPRRIRLLAKVEVPVPESFPKGHHGPALPQALKRWDAVADMRAAAPGGANVITVYGPVGQDMMAMMMGEPMCTVGAIDQQLNALDGMPCEVHINSPGGDVFEGVAIYNRLCQHNAAVTVRVMGLAASAASLIAMAGDPILMGPGSLMMIHNSWVDSSGDASDLRETADALDVVDQSMAKIYAQTTGLGTDQISQMMEETTWMTAEDCVKQGFATGMMQASEVQRSVAARQEHKIKNAVRFMESVLMKDEHLSRSEARAILGLGKKAGAFPPLDTHDAVQVDTHDAVAEDTHSFAAALQVALAIVRS